MVRPEADALASWAPASHFGVVSIVPLLFNTTAWNMPDQSAFWPTLKLSAPTVATLALTAAGVAAVRAAMLLRMLLS